MSFADHFNRYPFVRIAVFWAAGSAAVSFGEPLGSVWIWWVVAGALAVCAVGMAFRALPVHTASVAGIMLSLSLFALGAAWTQTWYEQNSYKWPEKSVFYRGIVEERLSMTSRSTSWSIYLIDDGRFKVGKRIRLTLLRKDSVPVWHTGDAVWLYGRVNPLRNNGNPGEPDYAGIQRRNGWAGRMAVWPGHWRLLSGTERTSVWEQMPFGERLRLKAISWRGRLSEFYAREGIKGDGQAVLSALTLGDKRLLTKEIRDRYSRTGTSHVLALSGLHLGIFYFFLSFILAGFYRIPGGRIVRELLLIAFVWGFVWLASAPLSLVRAAVMCSLLSVGRIMWERAPALNNLAVAAWIILLFVPSALQDVGFQLSFAAVAFILLLQPWAMRLWSPRNRWVRRFWELTSVSCCAQLGTAPLAAFYFYQFPMCFLLTNWVIVPLVTLLLGTSVLFFALGWLPWVGKGLAAVLSVGVTGMNVFLDEMANWSWASIEVHPTATVTILIYLFIGCIYLGFRFSWSRVRAAAWVLLSAILLLVVWPVRQPYGVWIYHIPGCPLVHWIAPEVNCAWSNSPARVRRAAAAIEKNFWRKHGWTFPDLVHETDTAPGYQIKGGLVCLGRTMGVLAYDDRWNLVRNKALLQIDYLYVCRGCHESPAHLFSLFKPVWVVLDASLSEQEKISWQAACRERGIGVHNLSEQGAFYIPSV